MKRIFKIDVPACHGYSFAVSVDTDNEQDAIQAALKAGCFEDDIDAEYAMVEDITDDEFERKAFKDCTHDIPVA